MPLYEYQCDDCEHRFERIQKFSDELVRTCPSCGGSVRKLLSSPAIQFKGTGWYVTDYARKTDASKTDSEDRKKETTETKPTSKESKKPTDSKSKSSHAT
jgi:putative FmdB family regulatory protein